MAITFPGSWVVFAVTKKAPTGLLAPSLKNSSAVSVRIKNPESAARAHRRDVTAAEAEVSVSGEHRILQQARGVVVRINRIDREIVSAHRAIRRKWRGDHFINSNTGASQSTIQAVNEAVSITNFRAFEKRGLFHRAPHFAAANDLVHIA